ncbi:hypothetical protein VM98_36265, partial [Streptomyces rubellomurinus subsp. indigoferus]
MHAQRGRPGREQRHPAARPAPPLPSALAAALPSDAHQLALPHGSALAPRLARAADAALTPPAGPAWRLD